MKSPSLQVTQLSLTPWLASIPPEVHHLLICSLTELLPESTSSPLHCKGHHRESCKGRVKGCHPAHPSFTVRLEMGLIWQNCGTEFKKKTKCAFFHKTNITQLFLTVPKERWARRRPSHLQHPAPADPTLITISGLPQTAPGHSNRQPSHSCFLHFHVFFKYL